MAAQTRDKMKQTLLLVYVGLCLILIVMVWAEGLRGETVSAVRTPRPTTEITLPLETTTPRHQHTETPSATPTLAATATEEVDD